MTADLHESGACWEMEFWRGAWLKKANASVGREIKMRIPEYSSNTQFNF